MFTHFVLYLLFWKYFIFVLNNLLLIVLCCGTYFTGFLPEDVDECVKDKILTVIFFKCLLDNF
jgi:hypothetical protein